MTKYRYIGGNLFKRRDDGLWCRVFPWSLWHRVKYFRLWLMLRETAA